jgi:hypothetical protein
MRVWQASEVGCARGSTGEDMAVLFSIVWAERSGNHRRSAESASRPLRQQADALVTPLVAGPRGMSIKSLALVLPYLTAKRVGSWTPQSECLGDPVVTSHLQGRWDHPHCPPAWSAHPG